mgnify:FL=1
MNNSLKNKIVYETIDFVIFLVVFCITEAIIDLVMGWDLWNLSSRTTSQVMTVISIACGVNGLVFTFIGHYRSKRNQKKIDEQYGKLFDEAGI